jgi:hypothetical protein
MRETWNINLSLLFRGRNVHDKKGLSRSVPGAGESLFSEQDFTPYSGRDLSVVILTHLRE